MRHLDGETTTCETRIQVRAMRIDQTFVALDLELTGLDPASDAIIEVAAVKFRGGQVISTWASLVNPRRPVPHKIVRLTGIRQADLQRAPALTQIAGPLVSFVGDLPLVGHSVANDVAWLAREGIGLSNQLIDTFELTNVLLPHLSGRGLEAISHALGLGSQQHHRATADAMASKELFCYLIDRALELDMGVVQEINRVAATADWPLRELFLAIEREKSRTVFTGGTSLRQVLAAKASLEEASLDAVLLAREPIEPLEPVHPRRKIDAEALARMLSPEGAFATAFPGYEHRPQQIEMLKAVAAAFNEGRTLVAEAGTGTGKSLAYLLPAVEFAVANNQHVVVSTKTINLQDQLFNKDIPDLKRILSLPFKASLLKGRSNYLCLRRYGIERRRQGLTRDEAGALIKVLVWLPTTKTGDWAEISLTPGEKAVWPRLAADGEHCLGSKCPFHRKRTCFLYRARWEAMGAHIIIVNHALLLSELGDSGAVLPDYRYLIVDEAHNLEDVATEQLGHTFGRREVEALLDDLSREAAVGGRVGLLGDVQAAVRASTVPATVRRDVEPTLERAHSRVDDVRHASRAFAEALRSFLDANAGESREYSRRLRLTKSIRSQTGWAAVESAWEVLQLRLVDLERDLRSLSTMAALIVDDGLPDGERLLQDLDGAVLRSETLREIANSILGSADPAFVHWAEDASHGSRSEARLRSAPLEVADRLKRDLFDDKEAVVLTSATLSIAGTCDYVARRLGLADAASLILDSPFDYKRSTLIYLPDDIPEPGTPGHQKAIERAVVELCRATEGRAMVLFTSHSQLATTFHAIRRPLQQDEILVVAQRVEGTSRRQLLSTFRSNPRTVLLGSASFWEGVDVVGESLSVLVIAKLPFAVPTEPVFAARSETFADPFHEYSLPQTILKFKQGFGRLIRSRNDTGIVVILDRRIQTKSYGAAFIRSLPSCTVRRGSTEELPGVARAWLDRRNAQS